MSRPGKRPSKCTRPGMPFSCGRGRPASQIWGVVVTAQQLLLYPLPCVPASVQVFVPVQYCLLP